MSKELTERWRKGKLPENWYYVHLKSNWGGIDCITINYCDEDGVFEEYPDEDIKEVLASVPTYAEFKDLMSNLPYIDKCRELTEKVDQLSIISEQLKEANDLLSSVWDCRESREYHSELAENYFKKWGLK